MTFIKWFTGNDLFTPCLSISYSLNIYAVLLSCKDMEVLYMRDVMKQGGHQRKQFCSLHASLQSKPYLCCTLFLFPQLQGLVWCQGPECIPSALEVWLLGLGGMREELAVVRRSPPEKFVGEHQWGLTPGWRSLVLLAMLLGLAPGGEEDREWICSFW